MSFVQHTECITESEKYFGSHHKPKPDKDKNKKWMDTLRSNLSGRTDFNPFTKRVIDRLLASPNLPRRKDKFAVSFEFFIANSSLAWAPLIIRYF